jgi:hypothetical protein
MVVTLVLSHGAAAQPQPCRPGENLLSLGKAAFFRSIERGAFAIGERTLEDLTDGLGRANAATPASRAKRPRATVPAQARGVVFSPASDAALIGALLAYVESPSSEAADGAFQTFLEVATKILFETPPETGGAGRVGLVLEDSQFSNRSSTFTVQDMTREARRLKVQYSLFGDGPDLQMGKADKMLSATPFFKAPIIADTRNIDRNNLGIEVTKDQDLRTLWFEDYRSHLATATPSASPAQITDALNAGWPILQQFWAFKRTEIFIDRALMTFGTEMRLLNERVTTENLPPRECDPKGR